MLLLLCSIHVYVRRQKYGRQSDCNVTHKWRLLWRWLLTTLCRGASFFYELPLSYFVVFSYLFFRQLPKYLLFLLTCFLLLLLGIWYCVLVLTYVCISDSDRLAMWDTLMHAWRNRNNLLLPPDGMKGLTRTRTTVEKPFWEVI